MKVLVCGGRDFRDPWHVYRVLTQFHAHNPISLLIHGGARGVDFYAANWARQWNVETLTVEADWERLGRAAGPIRNQEMLMQGPDTVIAFRGGKGTADMVRRARAAGVKVMEVGY